MSRKLPLGRRHKNGTGNNKKVAAKREIVRTKKAKKKAKKQSTIFVSKDKKDRVEAALRAEAKESAERADTLRGAAADGGV